MTNTEKTRTSSASRRPTAEDVWTKPRGGASCIVYLGGGFLVACVFLAVWSMVFGPPSSSREPEPQPTVERKAMATAKPNSFACYSQEAIEDIMDFVAAGDHDSANAYIQAGRCFIMVGGEQVTVTGMGLTTVEFVWRGEKLWAIRGAIEE